MANPLPDMQRLNIAIRTMQEQGRQISDSMRAHTAAQDEANTELGRVANFPVTQMQQQLDRIIETLERMEERSEANANALAVSKNSRVHRATEPLFPLVSVQRGPNPRVPLGQPIPGFPGTPRAISSMSAEDCRLLLTSLGLPALAASLSAQDLRSEVRGAVGLPEI